MKTTISLILSLLSSPAFAQWYSPTVPEPIVTQDQPQAQSWVTNGNRTYGSDGTMIQQYGNRAYVTPTDPAKPQVVCQTFGTVTTCQ